MLHSPRGGETMSTVFVGDVVQVRGVVKAIDGNLVTIRLSGFKIPVTVDMSNVERPWCIEASR
jgi:hypothetical protein